ncbi:hypothetical protein ACBY01_04155 [Sphingomonas sp. ac-8]|uniref:hypothetical protein n=1 Tax=Sphingomonas sp. ac-8 TaxID=3242977 RepID=UPI003A8083DB
MRLLIRLLAGLTLWAAAFALLYGLHGIGCAVGWDRRIVAGVSVQHGALAGAWFVSLVAAALLAWRLRRPRATVLDRATAALGLVGLAATFATGLPILTAPACL